jgi:hypothetical protein
MICRLTLAIALAVPWMGMNMHAREGQAEGPTFNRDVAPIIFENCVGCHHPGGNTPFSLVSYADVRKRSKLIRKVTAERFMPPWMPEQGHGDFVGVRRLNTQQVTTITAWVNSGSPEGKASDLVVLPKWTGDWQLGAPDIVVTMAEPFKLPAEGPDVYRNFVIQSAITNDVFLRALEFRPGSGVVHHAFVFFDSTGSARRLDSHEAEYGYPGMDPGEGARAADAVFCSWQPGKRASEAPQGFSTRLAKGTDLILQMHMRCSGKPELVKPQVALYFTKDPPTRFSQLMFLRSVRIDIPAGSTEYAVESSYKLPVDVEVLSVLPHMHYLGKEAHAWAELPDGTRREMLLIKRWNFDWQGDYRYTSPIALPKGTTLRMRYTYDNSAGNPRNPNHPPRGVTYGLLSSDEMGEFWLQVAVRNNDDLLLLRREYERTYTLPDALARAEVMVSLHPHDPEERIRLARSLVVLQRPDEALQELQRSMDDDATIAEAYYVMGGIFSKRNDAEKARLAFERAIELDPLHAKAHNNLGWVLFATGQREAAIRHLKKAVELDPTDELARKNLARALGAPASGP